MADMISHPPHYTKGSVECIDAIRAALGEEGFKAYCRGNAMKYIWRSEHKGDPAEDLKKAQWYLSRISGEKVPARPIDPLVVFASRPTALPGDLYTGSVAYCSRCGKLMAVESIAGQPPRFACSCYPPK